MWPRDYHPLDDDGHPDTDTVVPLFAHEPGNTDALIAWAGGHAVFLNGGPVVVLPGHRAVSDRLVGLGDLAAKPGTSSPRAVPGTELGHQYQPTDVDDAPPAD